MKPAPGAPADSLPLDDALEFLRVLWGVEEALRDRSRRMVRSLGVTGPQRLVLRVVGKFPGISAGELAEALRLHPSTITGILQRLGKRRLLKRTPDPKDARRVLLRLTTGGEEIAAERSGTVEEAVLRLFDEVSEAQRGVARGVLERFAEFLAER